MDSNYWSRHGETRFGRDLVSAHGSTSWEALIPRGTKSSNPASSSGESVSRRRTPPVEAQRKKREFEAGLVPCQTQSPANYRRGVGSETACLV